MIGLIGTYFALIVSLTQLLLPKYLKENISILIGILLAIIGSLILDFNANSLSFIIISLSCYGIALGLIYPNINSKISKISNTNNLGITLSINQMSAILGQSIGPIFLGYIYYLSPSYLSLSINFTICLLIFILFKKYIKS
jgi:MFS family permease